MLLIKKKRVLKVVLLLLFILVLAAWLWKGGEVSPETILYYTPENPWLAAGFLILLYAGKSIVMVFPLMVLQITVGILFSPVQAVVVNLLGITVSYCVAYFIGAHSQEETIHHLKEKYPKLAKVIAAQQKGDFFVSFLLRTIGGIPGDVVSMYLGAIGIPFVRYLCGSLLGVFPSVLMTTLMGASITTPGSPLFILSMIGKMMFPVLATFVYWRYHKRKKEKETEPHE